MHTFLLHINIFMHCNDCIQQFSTSMYSIYNSHFYNMPAARLSSLTFRTSSRSFSDISGNSILWEGSMMACSLAIWFVMLWNGVFPYVMQYRMHPRDHTSPLGLIFKEQETTISVLWKKKKKKKDHYLNVNWIDRRTFERAFPGWDEVSLMASGGI